MRDGHRPGWDDGLYELMRDEALNRPRPRALRAAQDHRRAGLRTDQTQPAHRQFMRRGRAAAQSEWRLVAATHNLLKLHPHWIVITA